MSENRNNEAGEKEFSAKLKKLISKHNSTIFTVIGAGLTLLSLLLTLILALCFSWGDRFARMFGYYLEVFYKLGDNTNVITLALMGLIILIAVIALIYELTHKRKEMIIAPITLIVDALIFGYLTKVFFLQYTDTIRGSYAIAIVIGGGIPILTSIALCLVSVVLSCVEIYVDPVIREIAKEEGDSVRAQTLDKLTEEQIRAITREEAASREKGEAEEAE